jgi:transcriptional regulator with XRE-family HTH domain
MNLRTAREAASLSQQALAEKAGVAIRTVMYAEGGRDIKVSTAHRFSRVLGRSIEELFPADLEEVAS